VISRKGAPNINGMGRPRYVVEQNISLRHRFKHLAVGWGRRFDLHDALVSPACSRRLLETPQEDLLVIVLRAL
jgi:hypothetical protein